MCLMSPQGQNGSQNLTPRFWIMITHSNDPVKQKYLVNKLMLHTTIVTDLVIGSPLKPLMTSQHCGLPGPQNYTGHGWCKNNLVTMEQFV